MREALDRRVNPGVAIGTLASFVIGHCKNALNLLSTEIFSNAQMEENIKIKIDELMYISEAPKDVKSSMLIQDVYVNMKRILSETTIRGYFFRCTTGHLNILSGGALAVPQLTAEISILPTSNRPFRLFS